MNSIKRLQIENFQSHVKTIIVPAPDGQLTVITGPSDAGKTVVLRALRWLLLNEPQGADFIRVGASFARVTVELESGHTVIRERTKSTNRYKIVAPDTTEPQIFEGFGNSVPLEVQELTGVRPVKIGDLELNLNLAEQLSGPFLGSSISSGARAKVLGKLAGTEEIDYAAKQLGADLYRRGQDEKRLEKEIADLEVKIKEFDWLPAMEMKIEKLSAMVERIKLNQAVRDKLAELKERLAETDAKIAAAQAVLWRWRNLALAEEILAKAAENRQSREMLVALTDRYWTYEKSIMACEKVIKKYAGLPEAKMLYSRAERALAKANVLRQLKTRLHGAENGIREAEKVLSRLWGVDETEEIAGKVAEALAKRDVLVRLRNGYISVMFKIEQEQKTLGKLAGVEEAEGKVAEIIELQACWARLSVLRDRYAEILDKIDETRAKAVMWENRVAELDGVYHDLLETAGVCPLCGQEIKTKIREAV